MINLKLKNSNLFLEIVIRTYLLNFFFALFHQGWNFYSYYKLTLVHVTTDDDSDTLQTAKTAASKGFLQ